MIIYPIYSNNPTLEEILERNRLIQLSDDAMVEIVSITSSSMAVLNATKAAVRQGATLLSNPFAGLRTAWLANQILSPAPITPHTIDEAYIAKISAISPFISLLTTPPQEMIDFASIKILDQAIAIYKKKSKLRFIPHSDNLIRDFQATDCSNVADALRACNAPGGGPLR
ncbi:MAG: hypothetical protein FWC78_01405 [Defluviitaleaceae bacterium]|nr:hypothetical protein [Defluviitaleaceae bacterium]